MNNLEKIQSVHEDVYRLYSNTKSFYIRDLSIHGFLVSSGVLELMPSGYQGTTIYVKHLQQYLAYSKQDVFTLLLLNYHFTLCIISFKNYFDDCIQI